MKILLILIVAPNDNDVNEQLRDPRQGETMVLKYIKVETEPCPVFLDKLYRVTVQYEP